MTGRPLALDDLDGAAIGTLHSFAQRILTMHPIEAGLPPLIEILDEVGSSVAFDNRWAVMQRALLDDETLARAVRLAFAAGVKLEHVRSLARAFQSDWDLIDEHVLARAPADISAPGHRAAGRRGRALAARADECTKEDDKFLPRLAGARRLGGGLRGRRGPGGDPGGADRRRAALTFPMARRANWGGALEEIKDSCKAWQRRAEMREDCSGRRDPCDR